MTNDTGHLKVGRNEWPVTSFADASKLYEVMRDEYHNATAEIPAAPPFPNGTLRLYGRWYALNGNGRVWEGSRLVYDPPQMEMFA
jgi:hypothetical protein